jgi:ferritin
MLSRKIQDALNEQINAEFHSAYLYLSMAAYFQSINFEGFAHWMRVQVEEEKGHGLRIFDFINDRDGRVTLKAVDAPPAKWASPLAAFEETCRHEVTVTGLLNDLLKLAGKEDDAATQIFLHEFITEQVEEEKNALTIVRTLKRIGDSANGLIMFDRELGKREK